MGSMWALSGRSGIWPKVAEFGLLVGVNTWVSRKKQEIWRNTGPRAGPYA